MKKSHIMYSIVSLFALLLFYQNCSGNFSSSSFFTSSSQIGTDVEEAQEPAQNPTETMDVATPEVNGESGMDPQAPDPEDELTMTPPKTPDNAEMDEETEDKPKPSVIGALPLKIFPGAEGFGTESAGGRGGKLCFVTNTNDSGGGSLRQCLEMKGKRIVIFKTGGTIEAKSPLEINEPYISIYGQTAPGDGITIKAAPSTSSAAFRIRTHDVLVQHLRIRAGITTVKGTACCRDSLSVGARDKEVYNVVLDHNSISWGSDEIADLWYKNRDITISYNIFSEGLHDSGANSEGPAGRGFLVGSDGSHSISIHHNFFAHSYQRNPLLKTSGIVDVVNNLIYHWVSRGGTHDGSYSGQKVNWVKNKYIAKTNSSDSKQKTSTSWGDIIMVKRGPSLKKSAYFEDNIGHHRPDNSLPQWKIAFTDYKKPYDPKLEYHSDIRFKAPKISETPVEKLEDELPLSVGATLPLRDPVDKRLVMELKTKSGIMPNCVGPNDRPGESRCKNSHVGGFPVMNQGAAAKDSDDDGIPDSWETQHGLNPQVKDSLLDRDKDGYLNIEEWVYSLANKS